MTAGVYAITNTINGRTYIGSSKNIERRWESHRAPLGRGQHINTRLQADWAEYGAEAFEFSILEHVAPLPALLVAAEQRHLDAVGLDRTYHKGSRVGRPDRRWSPTAHQVTTLEALNLRMPAELHAELQLVADEQDRSLTAQINRFLREAVDRYRREHPEQPEGVATAPN